MNINHHFVRICGSLAIITTLFLSSSHDIKADFAEEQRVYRSLNLLGEAFERVRNNYVEDIEDEVLIEAAIRGMMSVLDPHSDYLDSKHFQDMRNRTQGQFGGLGIEITLDSTGYIRVVSPIDDTPASQAGIQPDDLITHINDIELGTMGLTKAVEQLRGPVNSTVKLKILRSQKIFDLSLKRKNIQIRSVRTRILDDQIGYIRITSFSGQTAQTLEKEIKKLDKQNPNNLKAFIIDLRNNPGGLLDQAVRISDGFLDRGEIVSIRGRDTTEIQRFQASSGDWTKQRPIAVLINGGSASASEILAGALQDHNRATLIGTNSFGKGSVQTIIALQREDAALKLTTQYYYTPSGRSITKIGLEPDIKVTSLPPIQNEDGTLSPPEKDVQLDEALSFLKNKIKV